MLQSLANLRARRLRRVQVEKCIHSCWTRAEEEEADGIQRLTRAPSLLCLLFHMHFQFSACLHVVCRFPIRSLYLSVAHNKQLQSVSLGFEAMVVTTKQPQSKLPLQAV